MHSIVSIIDFYVFFPVSYTLYFVMLLSLLLLCDDVQGNKTKEKIYILRWIKTTLDHLPMLIAKKAESGRKKIVSNSGVPTSEFSCLCFLNLAGEDFFLL